MENGDTQNGLDVVLLRHLRPVVEMLRLAALDCPEPVFAGEGIAVREHLYHSIVGMDIWLGDNPETYPYHEITDLLASQLQRPAPPEISRRFLLAYVGKLEARLDALPLGSLLEQRKIYGADVTLLDQCLMQMRHVQHHLGAIDEILRRNQLPVLKWRGFGG